METHSVENRLSRRTERKIIFFRTSVSHKENYSQKIFFLSVVCVGGTLALIGEWVFATETICAKKKANSFPVAFLWFSSSWVVNGEVSAVNKLRVVYWPLPDTGDDFHPFKVNDNVSSIGTVRKKSIINCIILNVSEAFDFHIKFYWKSDFVGSRTLAPASPTNFDSVERKKQKLKKLNVFVDAKIYTRLTNELVVCSTIDFPWICGPDGRWCVSNSIICHSLSLPVRDAINLFGWNLCQLVSRANCR